MRILIDGYNLIRAVPELAILDREDLEAGRSVLLRALSSYRSVKGHSLSVVFDGSRACSFPAAVHPRGIDVVFSRPPRNADDLLAERCRAGKADLLVTSDSGLASRVDRSVEVMGSREFWEKVESSRMAELKGEETEEETRRAIPGRKPGKRERRARRLRSRL